MWFKVTNKCRGKYFVCAVSVTKMYLQISVNRYTIQALIIITYDKCGAGEKIWTKTTDTHTSKHTHTGIHVSHTSRPYTYLSYPRK